MVRGPRQLAHSVPALSRVAYARRKLRSAVPEEVSFALNRRRTSKIVGEGCPALRLLRRCHGAKSGRDRIARSSE
jgi:hypothetical protein